MAATTQQNGFIMSFACPAPSHAPSLPRLRCAATVAVYRNRCRLHDFLCTLQQTATDYTGVLRNLAAVLGVT